jgi:hypothetical protein
LTVFETQPLARKSWSVVGRKPLDMFRASPGEGWNGNAVVLLVL